MQRRIEMHLDITELKMLFTTGATSFFFFVKANKDGVSVGWLNDFDVAPL